MQKNYLVECIQYGRSQDEVRLNDLCLLQCLSEPAVCMQINNSVNEESGQSSHFGPGMIDVTEMGTRVDCLIYL